MTGVLSAANEQAVEMFLDEVRYSTGFFLSFYCELDVVRVEAEDREGLSRGAM